MGWHTNQNQEELDSNGMEGQERCIHTNMHQPPEDGNFKDEPGNITKLASNYWKNTHTQDFAKGQRMVNN